MPEPTEINPTFPNQNGTDNQKQENKTNEIKQTTQTANIVTVVVASDVDLYMPKTEAKNKNMLNCDCSWQQDRNQCPVAVAKWKMKKIKSGCQMKKQHGRVFRPKNKK